MPSGKDRWHMPNPIWGFKISRCRVAVAVVVVMLAAAGVAITVGVFHKDMGFILARYRMVRQDVEARGIDDKTVLAAMRRVRRHEFIPEAEQKHAYDDRPLPIGYGQTISQPYIVAYMTELLRLAPDERVLEIATGSGYHTAILAEIAKEVYTVEVVEELAAPTEQRLQRLGYTNTHVRVGDGYVGWEEHAPYDAILVRGAVVSIPPALLEQLKPGRRMVIPVGPFMLQSLVLVEKREDGTIDQMDVMPVRFIPLPHYGEPGAPPQLQTIEFLLRSKMKAAPDRNDNQASPQPGKTE
jgi:protein-L-isoaspartate(D-aspartate) O-methyltransferase